MARFLIFFLWVCLAASPAWGGILRVVEGVVASVNLDDPTAPVITLAPAEGETEKRVYRVPFTLNESGCIDWSDPENRGRGIVFGLEPGNLIKGHLRIGKDDITRITLTALSSDEEFPGREKIADPDLLEALRPDAPRVPVVVLLKNHVVLKKEAADPESRKAAQKKISALQESVLDGLPQGTFQVDFRLENVPTLTGAVTLEGLKALAADANVAAIEKDLPMELMPAQPELSIGVEEPEAEKQESEPAADEKEEK